MSMVPEMLTGMVMVANSTGSFELRAFGFIQGSGLKVMALRSERSGESANREG